MKRGKQKESQSNKRVYKFQVPENYNVINEPNGESVSTSTRLDHENYNFFRTARAQTELNDLLLFREQPRQLLFLVLVVLVISYYTFTHDSDDMSQNIHAGIISGAFIFLVYCFLQTRDGLLVRPHPGLWRLVHGCSVMYLLLLAVLSVQGRTSAPVLLQFLFPRIGSSKKTISAALNCEINSTNIYNGISSIWFFAHVTGWWGKMCMFRDWRFCLVLSIAFEILELSLQFMIPDFKECWWDSLFMDTFGANLLGMLLGRLTLQYYESKEYDWSGKREVKKGYFFLVLKQFTPLSWSQYHWEVFSSFRRFLQIVFALIMCLMVELNAFILLETFHIPKESKFNSMRLVLMFLCGIPAAAEYYEFLSNPKCWRLGQNAWMILSIAVFENLVCLKFASNGALFKNSPPAAVSYSIIAFLVMFIIWVILFFKIPRGAVYVSRDSKPQSSKCVRAKGHSKQMSEVSRWEALDILFWMSFTPLLMLTTQWAY